MSACSAVGRAARHGPGQFGYPSVRVESAGLDGEGDGGGSGRRQLVGAHWGRERVCGNVVRDEAGSCEALKLE